MTTLIDTPIVSKLSDFALLSVEGSERHEFLHGQLINDLNLIDKPATQLSAWCNPKGQVISNFLIINTGTSYLLMFKQDLKEFVQKRLTMFVLRSDVQINDISDSPLYGLANIDDLSKVAPDVSTSPGSVQADDGLIIVCHPDNSGRHLLMGNPDIVESKMDELRSSMNATESTNWQLLDIVAGLPWITAKTQEQFLPQMLNLDALNAMSYQKGCYPGQEVIARLHYKGTVKKRVTLIKTEETLEPSDNIHLKQTNDNIGSVINAAMHTDNYCYALAVIECDKLGESLSTSTDKDIEILDLPYATDA